MKKKINNHKNHTKKFSIQNCDKIQDNKLETIFKNIPNVMI